jgi:hypothetical protein
MMLETVYQKICLLAMLAAPALVLAGEPAADETQPQVEESAPDARSLATAEAILDYCGKLDPSSAERYLTQARVIAQGASEDVLVKVRETNEYQQAHGELDESLAQVEARNAKNVCAKLLLHSQ